jgi:hypothetical protein
MNTQLHEVKDLYRSEVLLQPNVHDLCIQNPSWSL